MIPHSTERIPWPICICLDSFAPWQSSQGMCWQAKVLSGKGELHIQEHTSVIFLCFKYSSMCCYLLVYRLFLITAIKYFCHHIYGRAGCVTDNHNKALTSTEQSNKQNQQAWIQLLIFYPLTSLPSYSIIVLTPLHMLSRVKRTMHLHACGYPAHVCCQTCCIEYPFSAGFSP